MLLNWKTILGNPHQACKCGLQMCILDCAYPAVTHLRVCVGYQARLSYAVLALVCSCAASSALRMPSGWFWVFPIVLKVESKLWFVHRFLYWLSSYPPRRSVPLLPLHELPCSLLSTLPFLLFAVWAFTFVTGVMYIPAYHLGAEERQIAFYCLYSQMYYYIPKSV